MGRFRTLLAGGDLSSRFWAALGAGLGIYLVALVCASVPVDVQQLPYLMAPVAATSVLLFVVPASPMAQPWPVIGGTSLSGLLGVFVYQMVPEPILAGALAVAGSIALMAVARAMHPPGCAAALTAVIGPEALHEAGFAAALFPLGANALLLVVCAYFFHRISGQRYPHRADGAKNRPSVLVISDENVEAALAASGETYDIDRQDLRLLVQLTVENALKAKKVK